MTSATGLLEAEAAGGVIMARKEGTAAQAFRGANASLTATALRVTG